MNIYILYCKVVEVYAYRGAQTWWGASLACLRRSLIQHVITLLIHSRRLGPDSTIGLIIYSQGLRRYGVHDMWVILCP
jgi:hypothetical protein